MSERSELADFLIDMALVSNCSQDACEKFERAAALLSRDAASEPGALAERIAQLLAHRACGNQEQDTQNGKLAGYCVVCQIPWPCSYAASPPPAPDGAAQHSAAESERLLRITRENFELECADADKVLALFPELHRSEGGRLPVRALVSAICDQSARLKNAEEAQKHVHEQDAQNWGHCVHCGKRIEPSGATQKQIYDCMADAVTEIADAAAEAFRKAGLEPREWDGDDIIRDVKSGIANDIERLAARSAPAAQKQGPTPSEFDATEWWLTNGHAIGQMTDKDRILPADLQALAAAARLHGQGK